MIFRAFTHGLALLLVFAPPTISQPQTDEQAEPQRDETQAVEEEQKESRVSSRSHRGRDIVTIGDDVLVAADDVASVVAKVAIGSPLNGTVEVAGPEQFRFNEFISRGLSARKDPREVMADPNAHYFGAELSERSLVPGAGALLGETRFEDWLTGPANQIPPSPQPTAAAAAKH